MRLALLVIVRLLGMSRAEKDGSLANAGKYKQLLIYVGRRTTAACHRPPPRPPPRSPPPRPLPSSSLRPPPPRPPPAYPPPKAPPPAARLPQLSAGAVMTVALRSRCLRATQCSARAAPSSAPSWSAATSVSAGNFHTCGIDNQGGMHCWGLGTGNQTTAPALPRGTTWVAVSAGYYYTCGLTSSAAVLCWGANPADSTLPALTQGTRYTSVAVARDNLFGVTAGICGLISNGSLTCTGRSTSSVPQLPGGLAWTAVTVGGTHACGLVSNGSLACWGTASIGAVAVPTLPAGMRWVGLAAAGQATCGILSNGSLACWGDLAHDFTTPDRGHRPYVVPRLDSGARWVAVDIGVGDLGCHVCGLDSNGGIKCWGSDLNGATEVPTLGRGTTWTAVAVGTTHACGLTSGGGLLCWGGRTAFPAYPVLYENGQAVVPSLGGGQAWGPFAGAAPRSPPPSPASPPPPCSQLGDYCVWTSDCCPLHDGHTVFCGFASGFEYFGEEPSCLSS